MKLQVAHKTDEADNKFNQQEIRSKKMLSDEAVAEYQRIYKKHYGKEISKAEAIEQGQNLINLFKVIYKPLPKSVEVKKEKKELK